MLPTLDHHGSRAFFFLAKPRLRFGLTLTPPAVPFGMPPKVRDLEAKLRNAGFVRQAAKGSHRKWSHPTGRMLIMSGGEGDDAKKYQEAQVDEAIFATRNPKSG